MKRKVVIVAQVIVLLIALVTAGTTAGSMGKVLPNLAVLGGSLAPAGPAGLGIASAFTIAEAAPLAPVGTGFTYQGSLKSGGNPANGDHDFRFTLYDALSGGNLVSGPITRTNILVTEGLFAVTLDFGADAFDGNERYLAIEVRPSGGGQYDLLSPRQPISPVPYALYSLKSAPYKNVVTVAQAGGQFTSIQAALDSITDASATNRYLVRVAPGTYTERVTMKPWVDIEGSGEGTTRITFSGSPDYNTATLRGASNAELRSLTVENTGVFTYAIAILNVSASPSLLNVTAVASGASFENRTVSNASSSPNMKNVTVIASGSATENLGVYNESSSPRIMHSIISATDATLTYGVYSRFSGTVTIDNSKITAANTVFVNAGVTTRVGASQLSGGPVTNYGTLTCSASYDENYVSPGLNVCP